MLFCPSPCRQVQASYIGDGQASDGDVVPPVSHLELHLLKRGRSHEAVMEFVIRTADPSSTAYHIQRPELNLEYLKTNFNRL